MRTFLKRYWLGLLIVAGIFIGCNILVNAQTNADTLYIFEKANGVLWYANQRTACADGYDTSEAVKKVVRRNECELIGVEYPKRSNPKDVNWMIPPSSKCNDVKKQGSGMDYTENGF